MLSRRRRIDDARPQHAGEGTKRQTRGEVTIHASRRVRARRDQTHPRRKTWRSIDEASDCNRTLEGPSRRCDPEAAVGFDDVSEDTQGGRSRRTGRARGVAHAVGTTGDGLAPEAEG